MSIEEVLSKIASGESLTDEEIETVKGFKMPDVSAAKNEAAANARKKATEQHKAELAELHEKLTEYEEQIEQVNSKGSESEKNAKALEKLQKQLEAVNKAKADLELQNANIQRTHAFDQVISKLQFMDESARDLGKLKLQALLGETEDLSDADTVAPIVQEFEKNYPSLFVASQAPGTGTRNQGGGNQSASTNPLEQTLEQRQKLLRENRVKARI